MEATRPNINGENGNNLLLTCKLLSGKLLDEVESRCEATLVSILKGKYVVLSQDGWTDTHQEPVVAVSLHCQGKAYPLDFETTGAEMKTASLCANLAKQSIKKAEEHYGCLVVGLSLIARLIWSIS